MSRFPLSAYLVPRRRFVAGRSLARRQRECFLESLAVIALVGVLVTLALQYGIANYEKAALSEAANLGLAHRVNIAEHYAVTGELPAEVLTSDLERGIVGRFVDRVTWRDDEFVFELNPQFPGRPPVFGRTSQMPGGATTLSYRIATMPEAGRLVFLCGRSPPPTGYIAPTAQHTSIPDAYLPFHCRNR